MAEKPATDPRLPMGTGRLALLLGSLLLGVAVAAAAMPSIFRATPTDISRIGILLDALGDGEVRPEIVALGNSVVMSAVDARRLREKLPGHPLAMNLASTGQSPAESYLLHQELPDTVRTIVQLVSVGVPDTEEPLEAQKYNTFYMYGFRPVEHTREVLHRVFGDPVTKLLDRSDLAQRFQARWALRQLVDTQARILLRRDLALAEAESDLYHPQRYASFVGDARLRTQLDDLLTKLRSGTPQVSEQKRKLLDAMIEDARGRGAQVTVLLPPMHPELRSALGSRLTDPIEALKTELAGRAGVSVADATTLLDAQHFIDAVHPTNEGAALVTDLLARRLEASD